MLNSPAKSKWCGQEVTNLKTLGNESAETTLVDVQNGIVNFNQTIKLYANMHLDTTTNKFVDKKVVVLLFSANLVFWLWLVKVKNQQATSHMILLSSLTIESMNYKSNLFLKSALYLTPKFTSKFTTNNPLRQDMIRWVVSLHLLNLTYRQQVLIQLTLTSTQIIVNKAKVKNLNLTQRQRKYHKNKKKTKTMIC